MHYGAPPPIAQMDTGFFWTRTDLVEIAPFQKIFVTSEEARLGLIEANIMRARQQFMFTPPQGSA